MPVSSLISALFRGGSVLSNKNVATANAGGRFSSNLRDATASLYVHMDHCRFWDGSGDCGGVAGF
jgi:hypothetical protein